MVLKPAAWFSADREMGVQVNTKEPVIHKMALKSKMALSSAKNFKAFKALLGKDAVVVYDPVISLIQSSGHSANKIKA